MGTCLPVRRRGACTVLVFGEQAPFGPFLQFDTPCIVVVHSIRNTAIRELFFVVADPYSEGRMQLEIDLDIVMVHAKLVLTMAKHRRQVVEAIMMTWMIQLCDCILGMNVFARRETEAARFILNQAGPFFQSVGRKGCDARLA